MRVYLFELDSVRNSREEIALGQEALFHEIVGNGNEVVLTYNQLSDSAAFWAGLQSEEAFRAITELSSLGMIKVSLYGGNRTAAQYILGHISECRRRFKMLHSGGEKENKSFYFSLIPLDESDGALLDDLYNAIKYSDVQLLRERAEENPKDREKYLFLYRYAQLILTLSRTETSNVRPKQGDYLNMLDFLDGVYASFSDYCESGVGGIIAEAIPVLRKVSEGYPREDLLRRSVWYRLLESVPLTQKVNAAEAVIDLCYNYGNEDSLEGIECRCDPGDTDSFRAQFLSDFSQYWGCAERGEHVFHREDDQRKNSQIGFSGESDGDWDKALDLVRRNVTYARKHGETAAPEVSGDSRSERVRNQKRQWTELTRRSLRYHILLAVGYAFAFIIISYGINALQELLTGSYESSFSLAGRLLLDFVSVTVFGVVTSLLFRRFGLPDILETVDRIRGGISEQRMLKSFERAYAEKRKENE